MEELTLQYAALRRVERMKEIYMKETKHLALRGVGWVGKAALLSLGLLAMLALVVVMSVLTAVMLTALSVPAVRHKRRLKGRRDIARTVKIKNAKALS
jgi:hypothetical protein